MHIEFTFKNFEPSEHLKKYARRRFEKTGRFLGKSPALDLQVVLAVDKHRHRAEIKLTGEGLNITASEQSDDMYATIDLVTDKIESQVRKAAAKAATPTSTSTRTTYRKKTAPRWSTVRKIIRPSLCTWTKPCFSWSRRMVRCWCFSTPIWNASTSCTANATAISA